MTDNYNNFHWIPISFKKLHNRRHSRIKKIQVNQKWRHFCQNKEAKGLPIIDTKQEYGLASAKRIYQKLLKYNHIINTHRRDTTAFETADNAENKLLFNHLHPEGYDLITKSLGRKLTEKEIAKVIVISQINFKNLKTPWISKRIAKKITKRI